MKQIIETFFAWKFMVMFDDNSLHPKVEKSLRIALANTVWGLIAPENDNDLRERREAEERVRAYKRGVKSRAIVVERRNALRGNAK